MLRWMSGIEIFVILAIVVLIFGPGRIGKVLGELSKGLREFRHEIKKNEPEKTEDTEDKDVK